MRALQLVAVALAVCFGGPTQAQDVVHGANAVFAGPTLKVAWAIARGPSEEATTVLIRVANVAGRYQRLRLDGVDPFTQAHRVLVPAQALAATVDLAVSRALFADYPSAEIRLFAGDAEAQADQPALTVFYLGVPDTTPEFATRAQAEAYLAGALK